MVTPMRPVHSHVRMRGFTATEILLVLAIVGIITAIAAPNMAAMIRSQSVKTAAFDLFASLTLARSEAIKRNTAVTITPNFGNWGRGWQLTDANGNLLKQDRIIGDDPVPIPVAVAIVGGPTVTFARNGRLNGGPAQFTLTATSASAVFTRCVAVELSGRPRTC